MHAPAPRPLPLVAWLAAAVAAGCAHAPARPGLAPGAVEDAVEAPSQADPAEPSAAAAPAEAASPAPITIAAVGDVMLGNAHPAETGGFLPPDDGAGLLAEVTPALQAADLAFGNLEGPLSDEGETTKCRPRSRTCYAFRVPERYGEHLARAGFDVLSLANNHVGDFGELGRLRTRAVLDALGIRYSGAVGEVAELEVRGTKLAVVAFSVSPGTNDLRDVEAAARMVAELRARADLVVVSFHGGAEGARYQRVPEGDELFLGESRGDLRRFARAVIDAGAALVLGHGPHVVRGMEVYRGRLVAYSLGNFATYGGMNLDGPNGLTLVLEVQVAPDGAFLGGRIHPARQPRPGGPILDPSGEVIQVLRRLSAEDFGAAAPEILDDGTLRPPAPAAVSLTLSATPPPRPGAAPDRTARTP